MKVKRLEPPDKKVVEGEELLARVRAKLKATDSTVHQLAETKTWIKVSSPSN